MNVRRSVPVGVVAAAFMALAPGLSAAGAGPFSGVAGSADARSVSVLAVPAGIACAGLSNTTGNPSFGFEAGSVPVIFLQRFVPPSGTYAITDVCIGGYSNDAAAAPYDVVVFADDGGQPGTLLATIPASPAAPGAFPGTWMRTPLPGGPLVVTGAFWAGPRITTAAWFAMDFEQVDPPPPQVLSPNDGATFEPYLNAPFTASIVIAGTAPSGIPTLSSFGLAGLLLGLSAAGFFVLRRS